jgi:hypothetical protein
MVVFIIGSLIVHFLVMFIDYYLMVKPLYLNLHGNFTGSIFSLPMFPMMGAYGLLSVALYYFWERTKKAIRLAHEKQIQSEKVETVFKSMQRITAILAEHIATHNLEIMSWVESRKRLHHPVSEKVEKPCRKIAMALESLSEISFVFPYTEKCPEKVCDIEIILQGKLGEPTGYGVSRKFSDNLSLNR